MTILATLDGTITITGDEAPSISGDIYVTDPDQFEIELLFTDRAGVAASQRSQRLGVRLDIDRGDGVMVTLPARETFGTLTIDESAERWGDILRLQLAGERFSPMARGLLRSKRKIEVYLTIGNPANQYRAKVFTGWITKADHNIFPPNSTVIALDAAALFAQKRAKGFIVPPGSGRARLSIANELLTIGSIPAGHFDLGGDGGTVEKPVSLGDRAIVEFLKDYLGVLGAEVGFIDGQFVAVRYDPDLPPVMELNPSNIILPASLSVPETLAPNVTGVVSVAYTRLEPDGVRTTEERSVKLGLYSPMQYENLQNGDGSLTANLAPAEPVIIRPIEETITKTSRLGTLEVMTDQTAIAWYATRGARSQIWDVVDPHIDPATGPFINGMKSYIYPDGSTRTEPKEKFRRVRRTIKTKEVDENRNVIVAREARYFFHFLRKALWSVVGGVDVPVADFAGSWINDEGEAVLNGREIMGLLVGDAGNQMEGGTPLSPTLSYLRPDELDETFYTLNDDGAIIEERTLNHYYDIGAKMRHADGAYGYGTDSRTYASRPAELYTGASDPWGGLRETKTTYRAINEDRYEVVTAERLNGGPWVTQPGQTMTGSLPRPERAEAEQTSQEIRAEIEDRQRIAYAGEEIEETEHNEWIERPEEAAAYVRWQAMKKGATMLSCSMPIETRLHKWMMVLVNIPGASIDGEKFYVRTVVREPARFAQAITAAKYPAL